MWFGAAPLDPPTEKNYYCPAHDVYGYGEGCWMPGCTAVVDTGRAPCTQAPHHYDPERDSVIVASARLTVSRELSSILP